MAANTGRRLGRIRLALVLITVLVVASCAPAATPAPPTVSPSLATEPPDIGLGLLADLSDLPEGFELVSERVITSAEAADDAQECASLIARGRIGGWEREFAADRAQEDGIAFVQVWASMYDDRDGAIWAFGENVDQTRSDSAVHLNEAAIDGLGDSAVHFDIDESGEVVTAISIVYFQIGSYASGVLVAGSDRTGASRIAVEIARRQLARQVRTA